MAVLDRLAPDQRAVLGLVLQQGRSYQDIADLLGISRSAVRARAHAGLAALAPPEAEVPADEAAQLADFLLGHQDARAAAATRALIARSSDARLWASGVAERLREVAPERVPELDAPERGDERPLRSSRLGGILLIAGALLVVAVAIAVVVLGGGKDEPSGSAAGASPTASPTATATPRIVGQIALKGSSKASGTMTLFLVGQQLGFQIEGRDVPPNTGGDRYAVWFTGRGGKADLIGVARDAVGADGALGVSGPPAENAKQFPQQLASHRRVLVTRETRADATKPGPVVLSGTLPGGSS